MENFLPTIGRNVYLLSDSLTELLGQTLSFICVLPRALDDTYKIFKYLLNK